jgi:hypothetical protein
MEKENSSNSEAGKKILFLLFFLPMVWIGILTGWGSVCIIDNYFSELKKYYLGRILSDFIIIFLVAFVEIVCVVIFFSLKKAISNLINKRK